MSPPDNEVLLLICPEGPSPSSGEDMKFFLKDETLEHLKAKIEHRPVSIFSVIGPRNSGKSLVCENIVRYLVSAENDLVNWLDGDGTEYFKWNDEKLSPDAPGIWCFHRPFIIKTDGSNEVAIVLLYTQLPRKGKWDHDKITGALTALTSSLSCCTIYNVNSKVDENCLAAIGNSIKLLTQPGGKASSTFFQNGVFLVRDWKCPRKYPFGISGGDSLVGQSLRDSENLLNDSRVNRILIKSTFENVSGCLLPFPGIGALKNDSDGNINMMEPMFLDSMKEFITEVINVDMVIRKRDENGVAITTIGEWRLLVEKRLKQVNKTRADIPNLKILDIMGQEGIKFLDQTQYVEAAIEAYDQTWGSKIVGKVYQPRELKEIHRKSKRVAIQTLELANGMDDEHDSDDDDVNTGNEIRIILEDKLEKRLEKIKLENKRRLNEYLEIWRTDSIQDYEEMMLKAFPRKMLSNSAVLKESQRLIENLIEDFKKKSDDKDELQLFMKRLAEAETKVMEILQCRPNTGKDAESGVSSLTRHPSYTSLDTEACRSNYGDTGDTKRWVNDNNQYACRPAFKSPNMPSTKTMNNQDGIANAANGPLDSDKLQAETEELISKLKMMYEGLLEGVETTTDLANNRKDILEAFEVKFPLQRNSSEFQLFREKLTGELDILQVTRSLQQMDMQKSKQTEWEKAVSTGIAKLTATNGMAFARIEDLEKTFQDNLKRELDVLSGMFTPEEENEAMVYKNRLQTKAGVVRDELINECTRRQQKEEAELKKFMSDLIQEYKDKLICWVVDGTRSWKEIKNARDKARKKARESLAETLSRFDYEKKDVDEYMNNLQDQLQKITEDCKTRYEAKETENAGISNLTISKALAFYHKEMEKRLNNSNFIPELELQAVHDEVCKMAIGTFQIVQDQLDQCRSNLDVSFRKYSDENAIKKDGDAAIGIDLGTTFSCASVCQRGKVKIIPNKFDTFTTPSYVLFDGDEEIVGEEAKDGADQNPEGAIYDAKRILGKPFSDEYLQKDKESWPFYVVDGGRDTALIEVEGKRYNPEMISAKILTQLKRDAEKFLNEKNIRRVVITVPAYFNEGQRQATIHAAKMAGFEVVSLIKEPVAAAMAYQLQYSSTSDQPRHILIYDLGGGTFDVAILKVGKGIIDVITVDGDAHLGGEDFDKNMMEYCAKRFLEEHKIDLLEGRDSKDRHVRVEARRRLERIKAECERQKRNLTSGRRATVVINQIYEDIKLNVTVTRPTFEKMNEDLFRKTIEIVERALVDKKLDKSQIDDIVLVGGSTRIPKLQQLLKEYFPGKELTQNINPDEAVAYGAGLYAAIRKGDVSQLGDAFTKVRDITPMSMGVEVYGGGYSIIIPKGTPIPVTLHEKYNTAHNNQTSVQIIVYEGENPFAASNSKLGEFYLNGIPPNNAGQEDIEVQLKIDEDAVVHVEAKCKGHHNNLRVKTNKGRMDEGEIRRYLAQAQSA